MTQRNQFRWFRARSGMLGVFPQVLALSLILPSLASASPDYPSQLRSELEMTCTPSCIICHTVNPGISGTADQAFAVTLSDEGLKPDDTDSLRAALEAVTKSGFDSDGDGMGDIDELQYGAVVREGGAQSGMGGEANGSDATRDPSVPGAGDPCTVEIGYGCGAQVAKGHPSLHASLFLLVAGLLGLAGLVLRRRQRAG